MFRLLFRSLNAMIHSVGNTALLIIAIGFYFWIVSLFFEPYAEPSLFVETLIMLGGLVTVAVLCFLIGSSHSSDEKDS